MKNLFTKLMAVALMALLVCSTVSFAGDMKGGGGGGVNFGVIAGLNMANLGDLPSGSPSSSMLIGFHVGAFADFGITDNIYFQPGVTYSTQGAKFNQSTTSYGVTDANDINYNLSYINIPLNFSYRLSSGLNFNVGPYIGINLAAKRKGTETLSGGGIDSTITVNDDLKNPPAPATSNINSVDFGIGLGIGYMMASGLGFKAGYSLGLAKVQKSYTYTDITGATQTQAASVTNNVITVSVIYEFGKK